MAALIASPKTLHTECYVYLWQTKQKHSFLCSLFSFSTDQKEKKILTKTDKEQR